MKTSPDFASSVCFLDNYDWSFAMVPNFDTVLFLAYKKRLVSKIIMLKKLVFCGKGNRYDIITAHLNRKKINKMCETILENLKIKPNVKKVKRIKEIPDCFFINEENKCSLLFSYDASTDSLAISFVPSCDVANLLSIYRHSNLIRRIWNVVYHKSLDEKKFVLDVSKDGQDLVNYLYQLQRGKK